MRELSDTSDQMRILRRSNVVPPRFVEYVFYALIVYAVMAPAWGISVPLLGAGGMGLLALFCLWCLRKKAAAVYGPLFLPIGCAVSFLVIQWAVHEQSLLGDTNRAFVNWIVALIVVQSLFSREGFLHRFGGAALIIGLILVPHLNYDYSNAGTSAIQRTGLEAGVGFANPNQLAGWFGFCVVYLAVVAIETRRNAVRLLAFLAASGCLFVVGLTVSRGAFIGIAIAAVIAFRRVLKRGFLPVLLLTVLSAGIFYSGLFDQAAGFYTDRGAEDSGRFSVWPRVIQRFIDAPLVGSGEDILTYVPELNQEISPHNSFLYIGLASGIIPLVFYVAYWIKASSSAYRLSTRGLQNAPFQLPLLTYTLVVASLGASDFMFQWAIVALCNAIPRLPTSHITVVAVEKNRISERVARRVSTSHAVSTSRAAGDRS
jgi:hypothetical protein